MRKVFIGCPVGSGQLMINTAISFIISIREILAAGWEYPMFYFRVGDSDLCRARNAIVSHFLDSECTDLVLVDSDISWGPGSMTRLIGHGKDFVTACYRAKTDDKETYFVRWPQQKEMWVDPETGFPLLKVDASSIGFARLTRPCVQKLVDSLNGHYYTDPLIPDEKVPWLIDFHVETGLRLEEGYSLCKKWRELDGDVWVDPGIELGHMGPKIFDGSLMQYIEKEMSRQAASLPPMSGLAAE